MSTLNFYRTTPYNKETKEQIWGTIFTDAHDLHCGCTEPAAHILNNLIPPDHPSRHQTIDNYITNCYRRQLCLFGGKDEKSTGEASTAPGTKENTTLTEEKEEYVDINTEDLLAAAAAAEER